MIEKLRELKKRSKMTNQQIAEKSNLPESTVARIFSGKTPNPTVSTVISMARAMGGTAADLLNDEDEITAEDDPEAIAPDDGKGSEISLSDSGDKSTAVPESAVNGPYKQDPHHSKHEDANQRFYENIISMYQVEIKKKDKWLARLFWCLAAIVLFIMIVLIFDITHPNFGFVKY